jgi:hypothetical protein
MFNMAWLKERASVEPPVTVDSGRPAPKADMDAKTKVKAFRKRDPADKENLEPLLNPNSTAKRLKRANKGNSSADGLAEILKGNNATTNTTLLELEARKDKRHEAVIALKREELAVEERRIRAAEASGLGVIGALTTLANAVQGLANRGRT